MKSVNDTVRATKRKLAQKKRAAKPKEAELELAKAEAQLAEAGLQPQFGKLQNAGWNIETL